MIAVQPRLLGIILIVLILVHTMHLVRSNRLSAHLAISWIVTEFAFLLLCIFDWPLDLARSFLGEGNTLIGAFLLGMAWMVFLMLDSLTRISALTSKLKDVNQELALLRERIDRQRPDKTRDA